MTGSMKPSSVALSPGKAADLGEARLTRVWWCLREQGFPLTPAQLGDGLHVLGFLRASAPFDVRRLQRMVGCVFAKTPRDVALFETVFAREFQSWTPTQSSETTKLEARSKAAPKRSRLLSFGWVFPPLALLTAFWPSPTAQELPRSKLCPSCPQQAPPPPEELGATARRVVEEVWVGVTPAWIEYLPLLAGGLAILILAALIALVRARRPRWMALSANRQEDALDSARAAPGATDLFDGPPMRSVASSLRRSTPRRDVRLDIRRTIERTLRNARCFTPVYADASGGRPVVLLIEQDAAHDHLAALYREAVEQLRRSGAQVSAYHYVREPLRLCDERGVWRAIDVVLDGEPDAAILVVGSGEGLMDAMGAHVRESVAERFVAREHRYFVDTRPIAAWDLRERAIADAGFIVAPATPAGFIEIAGSLESDVPSANFVGVRVVEGPALRVE